MLIPFPASRSVAKRRFSLFDVAWAAISPVVALYLSSAYVLWSPDGWQTVGLYCSISLICSMIAFQFFGIQDGMARYFSVYDALRVCKAVVVAELLSGAVIFDLVRYDGIPRSAPIIHALLLAAGLITARALVRMLPDERARDQRTPTTPEYIIIIGSSSFSALYIKLLHACAPERRRVIAVLDSDTEMFGRTIEGVRIVGAPHQLESIINEYALHGVEIDRVTIGGERNFLSNDEMEEVANVCERRQMALDFVPELMGLSDSKPKSDEFTVPVDYAVPFAIPSYFRLKRIIDFCVAFMAIIALLPLFIGVAVVVLLDVGPPVFFWQQRLGIRGSRFLLYKFRTMRPPFDWRGNALPASRQLSPIGQLLRNTSLDELPQLLNVLVGDMSLIGPRPLLPEDQPANSAVRLLVRPGITGWAQVNGGKVLTAEEKERLDEWYIRNASLGLDLRIVLMTLQTVLTSSRPSGRISLKNASVRRHSETVGTTQVQFSASPKPQSIRSRS